MIYVVLFFVSLTIFVKGCQDNTKWVDQDGDNCLYYRNFPLGAAFACNYPGYTEAKKQCPVTCATCSDDCKDNEKWVDKDGDNCLFYRNFPQGAAFACNYPGYTEANKQCPVTCGTCSCEDNSDWRDVDGDGCIQYASFSLGSEIACEYGGGQAKMECRKTCKSCQSSTIRKIVIMPPTQSPTRSPTPCQSRTRLEWRELSISDRNTFIDAVVLLNSRGRFMTFAERHERDFREYHGNAFFLPWHRIFIQDFENELRSLGPRFSCITLPYWDWSIDSESSQWWLSSDLLGSNGFGSRSSGGLDGRFSGFTFRGNRVTRSFTTQMQGRTVTLPDLAFSQDPILESNVQTFRTILEYRHGYPHNMIGGDMIRFTSPADPLFFLHHANVDRLWYMHQECHGHNFDGNLDASIPQYPSLTARNVMQIQRLGYSYSVGRLYGPVRATCQFRNQPSSTLRSFSQSKTTTKFIHDVFVESYESSVKKVRKENCFLPPLPTEWLDANRLSPGSDGCSNTQNSLRFGIVSSPPKKNINIIHLKNNKNKNCLTKDVNSLKMKLCGSDDPNQKFVIETVLNDYEPSVKIKSLNGECLYLDLQHNFQLIFGSCDSPSASFQLLSTIGKISSLQIVSKTSQRCLFSQNPFTRICSGTLYESWDLSKIQTELN